MPIFCAFNLLLTCITFVLAVIGERYSVKSEPAGPQTALPDLLVGFPSACFDFYLNQNCCSLLS